MQKRIGIVANIGWNLYNFRLALAEALRAAGYEVVFIAQADEYAQILQEKHGFRFVPIQQMTRKGTNPLKDWALYKELVQIYQAEKLEAVLHYTIKPNIYGGMAAAKLGIRCISTITGLGYTFLNGGWLSRLVGWLYWWGLRQSYRIIFQNDSDRGLFLERKLCKPAQTQLVLGSGIDTNAFEPCPKPAEYANRFIFLFVGRLLYDKGIREYLETARALRAFQPQTQLPAFEFWIVGSLDTQNPSALAPEELAQYTDAKVVQYWGSTDAVAEYMQKADVVVLPSYREGLSRVLLEALSLAKPIITTDTAGCKDAVMTEKGTGTRNGLLVPVQDTSALKAACLQILEMPASERQKMGDWGRTLACEYFDTKKIIQAYKELIN